MVIGSVISGVSWSGNPPVFVRAIPPTFVTDTTIMQLPINCVVAGQQKEPVKKAMGLNGAIGGAMRGIFNE